MDYISNTPEEKNKMLNSIGTKNISDLFSVIPESVLLDKPLDISGGLSELELTQMIKKKAERNFSLEEMISFKGGGAYDHYIPGIIDHLSSRSEFYTAYTPYQAELSQGTLQSIYEYQSMICDLTEMEIANASLLDGASATAEAILMAQRITKKNKIILSRAVNPAYREVVNTYCHPQQLSFTELDLNLNGSTEIKQLKSEIDQNTAAVVIQYPNFYGTIEKIKEIKEIINNKTNNKTLLIVVTNLISLGVLKPPGEMGADIVIGEGQPLGNPINYGGPYLGFMAINNNRKHLRQLPGRLAGGTTDKEDQRGYVLTMQTREQHIRRKKATSNICTNEALNALIATIYLATMGKQGLKEVAAHCFKKAHYLANAIDNLNGYRVVNKGNFFHEFWVKTEFDVKKIQKKLWDMNILAGINLDRFQKQEGLLVCVTEKRTKTEMDQLISGLEVIK